ncbi:hypothetical protein M9H77_18971 [Catharanthus roseus]|uniref:Uncharacterized protein n=1 Tax=Catharanthus roseus TaxID=4058 RepID=A0ACC0B951_CATRO|nr:hypothetical protein M9H77_18971 [Catharanthus roseus]
MDSFGFHNNIKAEKANAMLRYKRLKKITAMFRLIEICIFLIIISRFTTQLPIAFKISGEYFKGLSVSSISPLFVFILGNAIVIVLFLKSGQLSSKNGESNDGKLDLYDEYVKNCERNREAYNQEIKKQRKQSSFVSSKKEVVISDPPKEKKMMHRSHSENLKEVVAKGRQLRRTETEIRRKSAEEEMSSEEFRRTVEAFIARQQRFLREEEEFSSSSFSFQI